jgi:hypothetical protein
MLRNSIVYLDQVDIDGVLKSIKGDAVFLTGALTSNEGINQLELAGTDAGSLIDVPWIGKLKIATDFAGDMILSGEADPPKGITLKKADIKGVDDKRHYRLNKNSILGPGHHTGRGR